VSIVVRAYLRWALRHPAGLVTTALAVAASSMTVVLFVAVLGSFTGSLTAMQDLLGNATYELTPSHGGGFSPAQLSRLARLSGIRSVVPLVVATVAVDGRRAELIGGDQRAAQLGSGAGPALSQALGEYRFEPALLLAGVFIGPQVARADRARGGGTVRFGGAAQPTTVLGVVNQAGLSRLDGGSFVMAALPLAEQLAGPVNTVEVIGSPGPASAKLQAEVEAAVPGAVVGDLHLVLEQVRAYVHGVARAAVLSLAVALGAAAVAVGSSTALVVAERRSRLTLLRRLGAPGMSVVVVDVAAVLLICEVGVGVGWVLGHWLVARVVGALPPSVLGRFSSSFASGASGRAALVATVVGEGMVIGVGAAQVFAARTPAARRRGPARGGVLASSVAWLLRVVGKREQPVVGRLLVARSGPGLRRLVVAILAPAVLVLTTTGLTGQLSAAATTLAQPWRTVGLVVQDVPLGSEPAVASLPASWGALLRVRGVRSVVADEVISVASPRGDYELEALDENSRDPLLHLAPSRARLLVGQGRAVVISGLLAHELGLHEGVPFSFAAGYGRHQLPVAAIVELPVAEVAVSRKVYDAWSGGNDVSRFELLLAAGARARTVTNEVDSSLRAGVRGEEPPTAYFVGSGPALAEASNRVLTGLVSAMAAVSWAVVGTGVIGLLLASVQATAERRPALELLRRFGATPAFLRRHVRAERLAVDLLALVLASLAALPVFFANRALIKGAVYLPTAGLTAASLAKPLGYVAACWLVAWLCLFWAETLRLREGLGRGTRRPRATEPVASSGAPGQDRVSS